MRSAGLLPYRLASGLQVLIAHPGGPFFAGRDQGWWSVIKGLVEAGESDETTAAREFTEETGWTAPTEGWIPLGEAVLRSRKVVVAWAVKADFDPNTLQPGTFEMRGIAYPEIDRVAWFSPEKARIKLNPAQAVFVDRLKAALGLNGGSEEQR
jgi:predicted NUDIX family NTP pyrophosphohydrolase